MSDATVACCPDCRTSRYWTNAAPTIKTSDAPRYRCENGHTFASPAERPADHDGDTRHGLAKRLADAAPDDL